LALQALLHITENERRFSNFERLAIVRNVKRRVEAGESIRGACRELKIIRKTGTENGPQRSGPSLNMAT
jgi:hypothetical protein